MPTIWDLLPATLTGQVFLPIMPGSDQRDSDSAAASNTAAPTQTQPLTYWHLLLATPNGKSFVPMMPPKDQFDPWGPPAIGPTRAAPGPQIPFPGADRPTDPGFLGLALGQPASGDSKAAAPMVASANQLQGSSDVDGSTRQPPAAFWDLQPATPHGQPFVPFVPAPDQLDHYFPPPANARPVTPGAQVFFPTDSQGILGRFAPLVAPAAAAEASEGAVATRMAPIGATSALAAAMLLAMTEPMGDSTRKFPPRDDPEYRPQYVLRGGLSRPDNLHVDPLSRYGLPGQFGISSASAPNMTVDQIASRAQFPNGQLTYTTKRAINHLGHPVEPTGPQTYLHHSIMLPPGKDDLTGTQREALSALFRQHILPNPYIRQKR